MLKKPKFWLYLLVAFVFYGSSITYGFSQDDWYFLLISQTQHIRDVMEFFNPSNQSGFAFFRPISTQLYYFISTSLFASFAPLAMHLFMLTIQALNGYLVSKLLQKLKYSSLVSILVGILYTASAVHFLSLFYIAATQQLLAMTFSLLSLISFSGSRLLYAGLYFGYALLSKETAIVTPVVAWIISAEPIRLRLRRLLPYITITLFYFALRLLFPSPVQSEYELMISPSILTNIRWYLLFAANLPEQLVNYGLPHMQIALGQFITDGGLTALYLLFGGGVILSMAAFEFFRSRPWRLLFLFILGIFPVILLRNHLYPHYLDLALVPFLLLLIQSPSKMRIAAIFFYLTSAYISITYSIPLHWTTNRAIISQALQANLPWDKLCLSDSIAFVGAGSTAREASYILSLANGPRVICQKNNLAVYYLGVDKEIPPSATAVDITWINEL